MKIKIEQKEKKQTIPKIGQFYRYKEYPDHLFYRIDDRSGAKACGHNEAERSKWFYSLALDNNAIGCTGIYEDGLILLEQTNELVLKEL